MKRLLFALLLPALLFVSAPAYAIAVTNHIALGSADRISIGPTSAIDTTGSNGAMVCISRGFGTTLGVLTDSKLNTYTALTQRSNGASGLTESCYYNQGGTYGTGHTWTYANTLQSFPSMTVITMSGLATSPFDVENGAATAGATSTSLATGSITPNQPNEIVITGTGIDNTDTPTANSGVTYTDRLPSDGSNYTGSSMGYVIQTSAAAINVTWSWTTMTASSSEIASFKAAASTGPPTFRALTGVGK